MKKIQIAAVALLVTCSLIASFAFTKKSSHKPQNDVAYDYSRTKNVVDFNDANHLVVNELKDSTSSSWQQNSPLTGSTSGTLLAQIQFDADKGTLGQAAKAISDYYNANHTLPTSGSSINGVGFGGLTFIIIIIIIV